MKMNAIDLRSGNVIEYNGKLCVVVKTEDGTFVERAKD